MLGGSLVLAALLCSNIVSATPAVRRDDTPPTATASGAGPTATSSDGGAYQVCHNTDGPFAPFCVPTNGSSVFVDGTYYVTWDSSFFRRNETLLIQANYVNVAGNGPQAFQSSLTSNGWGHIAWTIQRDWLKNQASNNISLFISTASGTTVSGPVVMVTTSPITYATQAPTPMPSGSTLYIALPASLGFIVLCVCGGYIINRKHRQIGLGNIMSRGRSGYGIGKSRRQRLGLGRKNKAAAIALRDHDLTTAVDGETEVYRDVPVHGEISLPQHHRADSDTLGSLAGTPTDERQRGVNLFREELRRQGRERQ